MGQAHVSDKKSHATKAKADIKLFKLIPEVKELASSSVALEREFQTLLEKNLQTFFGVTFFESLSSELKRISQQNQK